MMLFGILVISVALLYFLYLLFLAVSWANNPVFTITEKSYVPVSILIPCRNEEKNIRACIAGIVAQNYPADLIEIIVVDDHSEDNTLDNAKEYSFVKLLQLPNDAKGKKSALTMGIMNASHELIITRDADTTCGEEWLLTIAAAYTKTKADLIICPVHINPESSILNAIQRLEHFALTIITGATAFFKRPIMCNGANLCFTKSAFTAVKGYQGNEETASGDDIFLLNKISRLKPRAVFYLKNYATGVYTSVPSDTTSLFHQRLRWAKKSRKNGNLLNAFSGTLIAACNILFVVSGVLSLFSTELTPYFIFTAILKCFIDILLLFLAAPFHQQRKTLIVFPLMAIVYPVYIVLITICVYTTKPVWKGRRLN